MFKQRVILRSIISKCDRMEDISLIENYNKTVDSELEFENEHQQIYSVIKRHYSNTTSLPSYDLLLKTFETSNDVILELQKLDKEKPFFADNFDSIFNDVLQDQISKKFIVLLKEASEINTIGKKVERSNLRGTTDAIDFLAQQTFKLKEDYEKNKIDSNTKLTFKNSDLTLSRYLHRKNNNNFDSLLTGIDSIDLTWTGIGQSEFWLLIAYTGELKSTLAMNMAYSQVIDQKKNVKYISLEMPSLQMLDLFVILHSANIDLWWYSKWKDVVPLDYTKYIDCSFNEEEEQFFEFLVKDLLTNKDYGNLSIYQPSDSFTFTKFKLWSEIEFNKIPFDIIYLDHLELLQDEPSEKDKDYGVRLNQRIKKLRQFSLNFNNSKGMRIVSAYQTNRKGKELADKSDGIYRLDALSYANEAERSATAIIYSYLNDELRANNRVKIGCLKHRTKELFPMFVAKTSLRCRKIYESIINDNFPKGFDLEKKYIKNSLVKDKNVLDMI